MVKLKIEAELELDEHMSLKDTDPEGWEWMIDVIFKEDLLVHSNEIGDTIGKMIITKHGEINGH
jgi:hypothetical protein